MVLQDLIGDAAGKMPIPQLRRQDGGFSSRRRLALPGEAARAPLPRGPRQARPLLWRRARCSRPTGGCSPYTGIAFSLHGELRLPTRRFWVSYTGICWGHWTVSQLLPVLPISNSNLQLATGNIGIGNISTLATFSHHTGGHL